MDNIYDIAIIGSGPAGFSASIYASRYRLSNIVFGKMAGGTIADAHKVCNYPGLPGVTGLELGQKMYDHAKEEGGEFLHESIESLEKKDNVFRLITNTKKEYFAKTIILATGTKRNKLHIPNEDTYLGKGVSYCATCDAMFYKDKVVAVVGGSSAATMAATMLSDVARQVYIIYRGKELRGEPAWAEEVKGKDNISILFETLVTSLEGNTVLERIKLSKKFNDSEYLDVNGLFIEIGSEPNATLPLQIGLELDDKQYIKVDEKQSTSIEGIWAAGDCTTNSDGFQQVVTAVAEGGIAANSIYSYLKESSNH